MLSADPHTIARFLELLCIPGSVYELRILTSGATYSGFYDDFSKMAADAQAKSGTGNIYVTLNPVNPELLSRATNRLILVGKGGSSKDVDIVRRSTILVDIDPIRPTGTPSTSAEHGAAAKLAEDVRSYLGDLGWADPITTSSGNGASLLYRVSLPAEDGGLTKRALAALAARFDRLDVKVDTSVSNAARITRVPGTLNMKGTGSYDRPHRVATIVAEPPAFTEVSREQLEQLAGATPQYMASLPANSDEKFDVAQWLVKHLIGFSTNAGKWHTTTGTWYNLNHCPFKGVEHTDGNTAIFQCSDGRIFAKCHHEKCKAENWRSLRRKIDPGFDARATLTAQGDTNEAITDSHRLARAVIEEFSHSEFRTLILNKGALYRWDGVWHLADDEAIKRHIWRVAKQEFDAYGHRLRALGKEQEVFSVTVKLVNNVFGALCSMIEVEADAGDWIHDTSEAGKDLLVCNNGIVDLNKFVSGVAECLSPLTPRLFASTKLDFDFNASAAWPSRWHQFLEEVWPHDRESRLLLQQYFGYALTNDVSRQKYLMLVGATRGGKGVTTRLLTALTGKENTCSIRLRNLGDRFSLAGALGKSLILIPDAQMPQSNRASEALEALKALTGGDVLDIDRKHQPVLSVALPAKVVMTSNQILNLPDESRALSERMLPLVFRTSFARTPDPKLDEKLRAELPGILLWAIEGWKNLRDQGEFAEPASSKVFRETLQETASPIQAFISESCVISSASKADKDELFDAWKTWCESREQDAGKKNTFGRLLFEAQPQIQPYRPRIEGKRVWLYSGIGLRELEVESAETSTMADQSVEVASDRG